MTTRLRLTKIRKSQGDALDRAALKHEHFFVELKGKPLAAILSADRYQRVEMAIRENLRQVFGSYRTGISEEEADRLSLEAKRWARGPEGRKSGRL